ncbi:MAG: hypothetical protein HYX49_08140 [Chloroflexi bacterium]|nr:hypothetical protein [Chloroflexota bacterium]
MMRIFEDAHHFYDMPMLPTIWSLSEREFTNFETITSIAKSATPRYNVSLSGG